MDVDAEHAVYDGPNTLTQTAAEVVIRNVPPDTAVAIVTEILGGDTAVLKEYKCDANAIGFHNPETDKFVKIERQEIEACDHGYLVAAFLKTLEEVNCGPTAVRDAWVKYCDDQNPAYDVDTRPVFDMPGSKFSNSKGTWWDNTRYDQPFGCVVTNWTRLLGFMTIEHLHKAVTDLQIDHDSERTEECNVIGELEISLRDILDKGVECGTSAPLRRPALTIQCEC